MDSYVNKFYCFSDYKDAERAQVIFNYLKSELTMFGDAFKIDRFKLEHNPEYKPWEDATPRDTWCLMLEESYIKHTTTIQKAHDCVRDFTNGIKFAQNRLDLADE